MWITRRLRSAFLMFLFLGLASGSRPAAQPNVNPTAAAVDEFNKLVKAYMDLHNKEESAVSPLKSTGNPDEVVAREKALATRIRTARADAKQGDVFTPAVVPIFKQIFADYYRRRSGRELRLLFDEVPNFTPAVNLTYPAVAPKANFPPRLALAIPTLPENLEYRLVGTHLVLRDTRANLIVDYITNVLPPAAKPKS